MGHVENISICTRKCIYSEKYKYIHNHGNKLLDKRQNLRESSISYNAGQKLLRQTRKTASYLTPQVMNNQLK